MVFDHLVEAMDAFPYTPLADGRSLLGLTTRAGVTEWDFVVYAYRATVRHLARRHAAGRVPHPVHPLLRLVRRSPLMLVAHLASAPLTRAFANRVAPRARIEQGTLRVLVTAQNRQWGRYVDSDTGDRRPGDAFIFPIRKRLLERANVHMMGVYPLSGTSYPFFPTALERQIAKERVQFAPELPHHALSRFRRSADWTVRLFARRAGARLWRRLLHDPVFSSFLSTTPRLQRAWRAEVRYLLTAVLPGVAFLRSTARTAMTTLRPDLLLLLNEYGRFERALMVAAHEQGIPVLAVQHGAIYPLHFGYMLPPGEAEARRREGLPPRIYPDRTAVYGAYEGDLLAQRGGYSADWLVQTGPPHYDVLARVHDHYEKQRVRERYGIPMDATCIVWPTQGHDLPAEENETNRLAVYNALYGRTDAFLVVKLHPQEFATAGQYRERLPANACVLTAADTLALLYAADIVVTKDSTTATEAVALDKPLVILNLGGRPDRTDHVTSGVAIGVYAPDRLPDALAAALADPPQTAVARRAYVTMHLHAVDGRAAARIADLALEMVHGTGRREEPAG